MYDTHYNIPKLGKYKLFGYVREGKHIRGTFKIICRKQNDNAMANKKTKKDKQLKNKH